MSDRRTTPPPPSPPPGPADAPGVGIVLLHSQLNLYLALGARLSRGGARVRYYVRSEAERRAVAARVGDGRHDAVVLCERIESEIDAPPRPREELVADARAIESRIGETINQVLLTHRHLGRGYSPGSFSYPRNRRLSEAGYWAQLQAVVAQIAFWEREIADHRLDVVIDGGKEAAVACRAAGVAFRWLIYARYKDHRAWAVDEYQSLPGVAEGFESVDPASVEPAAPEQYFGAVQKIGLFWRRQTLPSLLVRLGRNLTLGVARDVARRRWRGLSYENYVGYPVRIYRASQAIRRLSRATVESLKGRPYVYLPFQKEPEQALLMAAPEFTDQLAIAIEISRQLPAGVLLAISEHPYGIGRRPADYYAQLAALPNVVFFSFEEPPLARIAGSLLTATISGTAAFEAAAMGKPAMVFNPKSVPAFLPHVFVAGRDGSVGEIVRRVLDGAVDEAEARLDGARFQEALRRASFSLGAYGVHTSERQGAAPTDALVTVLHDALCNSAPEALAGLKSAEEGWR